MNKKTEEQKLKNPVKKTAVKPEKDSNAEKKLLQRLKKFLLLKKKKKLKEILLQA